MNKDKDAPISDEQLKSADFSLPDAMFAVGDNVPLAFKLSIWKIGDDGRTEIKNTDAEYVEIDGKAIFEGDIVLGKIGDMQAETRSIGIISTNGENFRWAWGRIAYIVANDDILRHKVELAIAHWQKFTPFEFILRTEENEANFEDYISFENHGVCQSNVGRQGGMQIISLGDGCSPGAAVHEIGHAIGLFHEQSRSDRDDFIKVNTANINPQARFNFNKQIQNAQDLGAYDYNSIMHYSSKAFSINNLPTIEPRNPAVSIGQRNGLSKGDVEGIKKMYPALNWGSVTPIQ